MVENMKNKLLIAGVFSRMFVHENDQAACTQASYQRDMQVAGAKVCLCKRFMRLLMSKSFVQKFWAGAVTLSL